MLRDDHGNPVTSQGRNVVWPASFDPKMFVRQGLADRVVYDALGSTDGGEASQLAYLVGKLSQFRHYGSWDVQRVGGKFNPLYVDYATIAIGLYSAAFGLSEDETLFIENLYALARDKFPLGTPMDGKYTHLPERNVINTHIGYQLYNSKSITGF